MKHLSSIIKKELSSADLKAISPYLKKAEKLSATNEEEAYLLGVIIKNCINNNLLSDGQVERLSEVIEKSSLSHFYNLKQKPLFEDWSKLALVLALVGIFAVVWGINALTDNYYRITIHGTYLIAIIREGGYMVILGLIFSFGGFFKFFQERGRNAILKKGVL